MKHDSQSEMSVNGFEAPYSYERNVTYENSMEHIRAVIKLSSECRQYIKVVKLRCIRNSYTSGIFFSNCVIKC